MNKTFTLLKLMMSDLWGINRIRHSGDKKARRRLITLAIVWVVLLPVLLAYVAGTAISLALLGLTSYIPALMAFITCLIIIFTTFMKAAAMLFGSSDHDTLTALPVSSHSLLSARVLSIYLRQLPFSLLIMLTGLVVYAIYTHPSPVFYILALPMTLILPLIPIVLASFISALLSWVGARFRNKTLAVSLLSLLLVAAVVVLPTVLSSGIGVMLEDGDISGLTNMMDGAVSGLLSVYPPASWFSGALSGELVPLLLFLLSNAAVFMLFIIVIAHFGAVMREAVAARRSSYKAVKAAAYRSSSPLKALYKKEFKRLFSSPLYVTNTVVGPLLAIIMAAAVIFVPIDQLLIEFGFESSGIDINVICFIAIILSFSVVIASTASASISLEGKNVWIMQSLPVDTKTILKAKAAVDLTLKLPCLLISAIIITAVLKLGILEFLILLIVPSVYSLFSSQIGLFFDSRKPNYEWTNEAQVIKQGTTIMLSLFIGMGAIAAPAILISTVTKSYALLTMALISAAVLVSSVILNKKNNEVRI